MIRLVNVCLCLVALAVGAAAGPYGSISFAQSNNRAAIAKDTTKPTDDPWWKHAVIYEIYPRSFQDSNGDGIGDLNGITQRLDYLQSLGVDALWLSPIYPSPQVDFGYDISDYENIDPQYGTLADFDRLVAEAKKRNIRIIMDMVMNHTSDKHPWFIESASSKSNPKRDWYVWRDGKAGGTPPNNPPNNWISIFGHSAWQYDPKTSQYYYHRFYIQQPDLNWRNPAVERAMFGSVRFWLDRGVAGFRLDAIPTLFEDPQLRDAEELEGTNAYGDRRQKDDRYENLPEVHDVMRRLRAMTDKYPGDRVLIGETYLPNIQELDKWYGGAKHDELELPMDMQVGFSNRLDANLLRQRINDAETKINGNQPLFVFDNHDNIRSWDRYGDGVHNDAIARILATILFTSRSTAMMYYGEEIGMVTTPPTRKEEVKDPIGITGWPREKGRDGERTPMQWDNSKNAGFSMADSTWLPVAANYETKNVKAEESNPDSLLNWHKQLITMRRNDPALRHGNMIMLDETNPSVLSYIRSDVAGHHSILVALNCTAQQQTVTLDPGRAGVHGAKVSTLLTDAPSLNQQSSLTITLPPYASWVGSLQ
ncbi:glycoside hydrolase family 13 protein [Edaphobacter bradus]|uniref:glycoside hydrolase family 13 protein n=1 Tax=Edaphobacter bradus TaxID=2259016 RepID=UPI0021E0A04E|nr:alpha-glucosidase [Edaphobacter bradus]